MTELVNGPLFALTLALGAYVVSLKLYLRSGRFALLHPTASGAALIALALVLLDRDITDFYQDVNWLLFLLGPATVALAIPLYRQLHLLRDVAGPLLLTTIIGGSFACLSALALAWLFGANQQTLLSLTTKSVTTPIAIVVTEGIGGLITVAVASVILTGVVAIVTVEWLFKKMAVEDDRVWGFCLGLAAHAIGTSRAFERSPIAGAFSSLALCLNGAFTAVVVPLAAQWFAA